MSSFGGGHRRRVAPSTLGEVLAESRKFALERSKAPMDRDSYRLAVGRRIAERTELGELKRGELTVYVASPAWAQELSLLAPQMIERLSERGLAVKRLRFRLQDNPAAKKPAAAKQPPAPHKPLPPELDARLQRVDDDELRRAIAGAAGLALGRTAGARSEPATSTQPSARGPRSAAARSAPQAPGIRPSPAAPAGTRAKRRG